MSDSVYADLPSIQLFAQSAQVLPDTSLEEFEKQCEYVAALQRAVLWWVGDLALAVERQHPRTHEQAWPEWVSPDLIARCKAVSAAYKPEERNIHATWTVHMHMVKYPDRVTRVEDSVELGLTSDEARRDPPPPRTEPSQDEKPPAEVPAKAEQAPEQKPDNRWLLAVDVNYFIHRYFHSGAGMETASTLVNWLTRLIQRMAETKGLTDAVCCVDAPTNHRKALTKGWENEYKPRADKDPELIRQLELAKKMLEERNLPVVSVPDMEADDVMASYAKQFNGRVTLLTQDKDMRQCLHGRCNILLDVTWDEHPQTNQAVPVYNWLSAKDHTQNGSTYSSTKIVGITPEQWPHFQAIAGDSTDGIKGCDGIGAKGAMELILAHGTVQGVIAACRDNKADLTPKKRMAVLDFEPFAETMLKLTSLRTDLEVPKTTRICMTDKSTGA